MIKHYDEVLDNGLRLVISCDDTKKVNRAEVIVKFGGSINKVKVGKKEINIDFGIAHILEHTIIEKSSFGNSVEYMKDLYTYYNGYTNKDNTCFYIETVLDFYDRFEDLLEIVYNPTFNQIEDVKRPIIEEIRQANNRPLKKFNDLAESQLYEIPYNNILGSEDTVSKITSDEIKKIYDIFYQPSNQIIRLSGNIDIKKTKKIINKILKKYKRDYPNFLLIEREEPKEVLKKRALITRDDIDELTRICFKFERSLFSNYELRRLGDYFSFMYYDTFSDASGMYDYLVDNKISLYSVNQSRSLNPTSIIFAVDIWSNQTEKIEKLVIDKLNHFKFDEERFHLWLNNRILDSIIDSTHVHTLCNELISNILETNTSEIDDMDYYKSLNIQEGTELYNRLTFNNYAITEMRHSNENN